MPKLKKGHISPTPEEDARIEAGIAADPDSRVSEEELARLRPATEVDPDIVERARRHRGRQKAPTKQQITIRLDRDIVDYFKDGGPGWQIRLNAHLRETVIGRDDR